MNVCTSVRIVSMRDGVDQSVDKVVTPITPGVNPSLGEVSECTPSGAETADRHDTTFQMPGTHP
jgi:hypothetical protein